MILWLLLLNLYAKYRRSTHPRRTPQPSSTGHAPSTKPYSVGCSSSLSHPTLVDLHAGIGHNPGLSSDHTYHTWT